MKVEALVKFNKDLAMVFDREPKFEYVKEDGLLWAHDSGFYKCFYYERPSKAFKAFGGREFKLPLKGGGFEKCQGQWWDGGLSALSKRIGFKLRSLTLSTKEQLKNCYVFHGASIDESVYNYLIKSYKGEIYAYWDYEKIIKYDDLYRKCVKQRFYFERAKKHLIANVKKSHQSI